MDQPGAVHVQGTAVPIQGLDIPIQELYESARRAHRAGDLTAAERLYAEVLRAEPHHPGALHSVGLLHHQRGRHGEAVRSIGRAIALDGTQPDFHGNLGLALAALGRLEDAAASFERSLRLKPEGVPAHHNLGVVRLEQGRPQDAELCFEQARRFREDDPLAYCRLAQALCAQGRRDDALRHVEAARKLDAEHPQVHLVLGVLLRDRGRPGDKQQAEAHFRQALGALEALGQEPGAAEPLHHLAALLQERGELDEAEALARRALELRPGSLAAWTVLGLVHQERGEMDRSIDCFGRALQVSPHSPTVHTNLGVSLLRGGRVRESLESFERALRIKPDAADARFNRSLALLTLGEHGQGWLEYEWRFCGPKRRPRIPRPLWDGGDLSGRTILLHAEQGLGDTLQFIRYVRLVKRFQGGGQDTAQGTGQGAGQDAGQDAGDGAGPGRGGRVLVACQEPLIPLLSRVPGIDQLLPTGQKEMPAFDVHAPLMSLPGILRSTHPDIPADVPYLTADPDLGRQWRQWLAEQASFDEGVENGLRIGIAWQGNPNFVGDRHRSVPLRHFRPLAEVPGVRLVSLQKGHGAEQLDDLAGDSAEEQRETFPAVTFGEGFDAEAGAFMDTAAVMTGLDLVITSDTAVAHLAGALGVPVWVALPYVPDWRWLLDREDSPWYPTMRLFRQAAPGDWPAVFAAIEAALRAQVASRQQPGWQQPGAAEASPPAAEGQPGAERITAARNAATRRPIARKPSVRNPVVRRVLALSFLHVGNFGDRLGFHLLGEVLPPQAEVVHGWFDVEDGYRPRLPAGALDAGAPGGNFDALVLGLGNSLFGPVLTDELLALVEQVPTAVGLFGTQYRSSIDASRLERLLDRLDHWFARSEEDVALFGAERENVTHLGDWLVNAFPLTTPQFDQLLRIGDEVWQQLPLDRTIQRIQAHRRVHSTRLHPLLCALTSAEEVSYREQREDRTGQSSGKFHSLLLDVFGREYPEDIFFPVDRPAVAAYKTAVRARTDGLREYLGQRLA